MIHNMKEWNALRANPAKWAAYLKGVEKRRQQMERAFLRKWKAVGGFVHEGKPAFALEASYSLPELVLSTSISKTYWLNLLKRGVLKSFRVSEIEAYLDSKRVPVKTAVV